MDHVLNEMEAEDIACSWKIHRRIGEYLHKSFPGRGILKSAFEHNVPIFVPAFQRFRVGIDFALHKIARQQEKRPLLRFDPFEDFEKFADTMLATKRMGILTVGGRRPSQLVATIRRLRGTAGAARLQENSAEALQLWRAHLPGAGPLGRPSAAAPTRKPFPGASFVPPKKAGSSRKVFDDATVGTAVDRPGGAGAHRIISNSP